VSRYRLVHFVPSSARSERFPIGALVETEDRAQFVQTRKLPSADALGGAQRLEVCRMALEVLSRASSFDALPRSLNSLASLGEATQAPADDAVAWVTTHIFPKHEEAAKLQGRRRSSEGYRALVGKVERAGIPRAWIRKTFDPTRDGPPWFRAASALPKITHWVGREGAQDVLLLEPIVLHRHSLEQDIQQVGMALGAYRVASDKLHHGRNVQTAAYVTGQDTQNALGQVLEQLQVFADQVFELEKPEEVTALAGLMRATVHETRLESK
jgi:hypothetical protein